MKFLLVSVILSALPLHARVGEKYADYEARVGKASGSRVMGEARMAEHRENGRIVVPVVVDGVIISEMREELTEQEAGALLGKLGLGEFLPSKDIGAEQHWRTRNGHYLAQYLRKKRTLIIHDVARVRANGDKLELP